MLAQFEKDTIEQTFFDEVLKFVCSFVAHKYKQKYSGLVSHDNTLLESDKLNGRCDWISLISRGKLSQPSVELLTIGRVMTKEFKKMHGNDFDRNCRD